MSDQRADFRGRLRLIEKRHSGYARDGYTARLRSDGLIEVVQQPKVRSRVSGRSLLLFIAVAFLFKGFLMATLGFGSYDERVAKLAEGTQIEKAGAFLMQADPLSTFVAEKLVPLLP